MMVKKISALALMWCCTASAYTTALTIDVEGRGPLKAEMTLSQTARIQPIMVMAPPSHQNSDTLAHIVPSFTERGFEVVGLNFRQTAIERMNIKESSSLSSRIDIRPSYSEYESTFDTRYPNTVEFYPDLIATLRTLRKNYPGAPLIVVGSTDMASLSLVVARDFPSLIDGLVLFSPSENLGPEGDKSAQHAARGVGVPTFITGAEDEVQQWQGIYSAIKTKRKNAYIPTGPSVSGLQGLALQSPETEYTWQALDDFLNNYFPRALS